MVLNGLDGARLVRAPSFEHIAEAAGLVIPLAETAVIYGDVGTGKRTALDHQLATQPIPVVALDLTPRMSSKDIVRRLHRLLVADEDHPERDLQDALVDVLAETPRIIVIRHADRLLAGGAAQLHWLHERPNTTWAMFLVGDARTGDAVNTDARLRGSIARTVKVKPLTRDEVLDLIPGLHGVLAQAQRELLAELDDRVLHGNFNRWARFLQSVLHLRALAEQRGRVAPMLDRDLARAVLDGMPSYQLKKRHADAR